MDKPTVQDIFNRFYPGYQERHTPSPEQAKAATCIMNCKTGAYGANVDVCEDCGCIQIHYNSCRNRCCPMCQALPKEKWMDLRREDVLEAPYFHVVFTVPAELNPIIYSNQKLLYDALYHAASGTLDEFCADPKYLGAKIGYLCILHARESEINFHPHIHAIVLGGGLDAQNHWKGKRDVFFLPVHVVSRKLRGKYMAELKRLITLCRNLLGCRAYLSQLKDKTGPEIIKQLWGVDICKCRHCGGRIVSHHKAIPLRN